jgi:hypothetical protein
VLARLILVDDVESAVASLGIEGGNLVRVSLRPGADPAKVAAQVQRVLREEVPERTVELVAGQVVPERTVELVAGQAVTAALERNEWLDRGQLADIAAMERDPSERRMTILLALLFAFICVVLCLLGLRYLRHRRADPAAPPLAAKKLRR